MRTFFLKKNTPVFVKRKEDKKLAELQRYQKKLSTLWISLFWIFGLQVSAEKLGLGRKIIAGSLFVFQFAVVLHFIVAIFKSVVIVNEIRTLALFLTVLFCNALYVSLWSLLTKRKERIVAMQIKLTKITSHDLNWTRSVWRSAITYLIGLNFVTVFSHSISASDLALAEPEILTYYVNLYIIGFQITNYTYLNYLRFLIMFEFAMSVIFSMSFLHITVSFFAHLCRLLSLNFKLFNRKIEDIIKRSKQLDVTQLIYFRHRHQELCEVADQLSVLFSPIVVLWTLTFIITLCFILRGITFLTSTKLVIGLALDAFKYAWLLLILFKDAAEVHKQAHAIGESIVTMPVPMIEDEFYQSQYNVNYLLFNQRLLNTRVGVTASGLFLLTNATFLSMTGTVLTYVIVLYQTS